MALDKTAGPTLGIPFAHALDAASGEQVPLVALHPDSPGIGGGSGGVSGDTVKINYLEGLTSTPVSLAKPLPVIVSNPAAIPVSAAALGGVGDAAEVDPGAVSATLASLLRGVLAALLDYDSTGAPLPAAFTSYPRAFTYTVDDKVQTETATDGVDSWVKTYTYVDGNLTGISGWVVQ